MYSPLISLMASGQKGGILRTSLRLANAFNSKGYRVHLLSKTADFPYSKELRAGISIKKIKTFNIITGVPFMAYYMIKYKPTVILTGVHQHTLLAVRARSLSRSNTRIYAAIRNPYSVDWAEHSLAKRLSKIRRLKKYYPRIDGIISISDGVTSDFCQLTGIDPSQITRIYNPSFDENINEMMHQTADHPWFEETDYPLILFVGRLEKQKNVFLLIDSFERVRHQIPCRLVLIGDGSLRAELEARVRNSKFFQDIAFLGHRANPFPFIRLADVLVLPSSWEGFGNVIVEALATGTPVVATDCPGGPGEILDGGKYGHLVPLGDSDAMAEAIHKTLRSPTDKEYLIRRAEYFSASRIAEQYLRLFDLDFTFP